MRPSRRPLASMLATSVLIGALAAAGVPLLRAAIGSAVDVVSREVSVSVDGQQLVRLPIAASHVVVRWSGARDATVSLALGRSPNALSEEIPIEPDEFTQSGDVEAFSDVIWADGARYARVTSDRPIEHLTVVALDTDEMRGIDQAGVVDAAVNAPAVITRAGWGANESYSVNTNGYIRYSPRFAPLQKLIVHHTAGRNNDPNPAATIRAIFYDHAVLRGYGDIDYNYLIDAQGRVYEGRRAWITTPLAHPTEEDFAGNVVGGSHARHFNEATVGIVLLGNFTSVMPTAAARSSLVNLLAWKAERHGLDPKGKSTYVNPADGTTKTIYNISGHRDVSVTACPGQLFYNTFPQLRQDVANRIAATTGAAVDSKPPTVLGLKPMVPDPTGAHTLRFGLIFSEPVSGLAPEDFTVGGDSPGWTVDKITGKAATYSVTIVADESGKGPHDGTVSLSLGAGQVTDLAGLAGPAADVTVGVTFAAESEAPLADLYLVPTRGEPPNTSFEISMQFTEPVTGFGLDDIVLGGTSQAATPWKVDRYFGQDRNFNFTLYNPNPANGTLTVQIADGGVKDLAGNPGAGSDVLQRSTDHDAPLGHDAERRRAAGQPDLVGERRRPCGHRLVRGCPELRRPSVHDNRHGRHRDIARFLADARAYLPLRGPRPRQGRQPQRLEGRPDVEAGPRPADEHLGAFLRRLDDHFLELLLGRLGTLPGRHGVIGDVHDDRPRPVVRHDARKHARQHQGIHRRRAADDREPRRLHCLPVRGVLQGLGIGRDAHDQGRLDGQPGAGGRRRVRRDPLSRSAAPRWPTG